MTEFEQPDPETLARARQIFAERRIADALADGAGEGPAHLSPAAIYRAAVGDAPLPQAEISAALLRNPALRSAYRSLVAQTSSYALPRAAAASSAEFPVREGDGCRIRVERSRADVDRHYVIIELTDPDRAAPQLMTVCDVDDNCTRVALPEPCRGFIQFLAEPATGILEKLRDVNAEIYFR